MIGGHYVVNGFRHNVLQVGCNIDNIDCVA